MIYFFGETALEHVSHIPLLSTHFIDPQIKLSQYDFLIITSKRSLQSLEHFNYSFSDIQAICIGKKTAEYAQSKGMEVIHTSSGYAKDLITEVLPLIENKQGLYIRPKTVANAYIEDYVSIGKIDSAICYETLCLEKKLRPQIIQPATLLFSAPSQVTCFQEYFQFHNDDTIITIGETTAKALPVGKIYHLSDEKTLQSLVNKAQTLQ